MNKMLVETDLLDFSHPAIAELFVLKGWHKLQYKEQRLKAIYEFVRDEIQFGYSSHEPMKASAILKEGFAQCNTKSILLMALLRKAGVPCRFHAFGICKSLQKGAHLDFIYRKLPGTLQHSFVEALIETASGHSKWISMEGVILDKPLLTSIQKRFSNHEGEFCGYAVAVKDLHNLKVEWNSRNTEIQHSAITENWSTYNTPDDFYSSHSSNLQGWRAAIWRWFIMRPTNKHVQKMRSGFFPENAEQYISPLPLSIFDSASAIKNYRVPISPVKA